ncbi:hypothetical protein RIF29_29066 [Crotalaria pallida]|uniref:Uncharacterized protein n=1 Tax=Crotalaria pallida TaxID=3830 RepID=A0AAN9EE41_CROPI
MTKEIGSPPGPRPVTPYGFGGMPQLIIRNSQDLLMLGGSFSKKCIITELLGILLHSILLRAPPYEVANLLALDTLNSSGVLNQRHQSFL